AVSPSDDARLVETPKPICYWHGCPLPLCGGTPHEQGFFLLAAGHSPQQICLLVGEDQINGVHLNVAVQLSPLPPELGSSLAEDCRFSPQAPLPRQVRRVSVLKHHYSNRSWLAAVARIVDLWAIRDNRQHIHLGSQLDVVAGLAWGLRERQ